QGVNFKCLKRFKSVILLRGALREIVHPLFLFFTLASANRSAASSAARSYTAAVVLVDAWPATFAASSVDTPLARPSVMPLARRSRAHTLSAIPAALRSFRHPSPK